MTQPDDFFDEVDLEDEYAAAEASERDVALALYEEEHAFDIAHPRDPATGRFITREYEA